MCTPLRKWLSVANTWRFHERGQSSRSAKRLQQCITVVTAVCILIASLTNVRAEIAKPESSGTPESLTTKLMLLALTVLRDKSAEALTISTRRFFANTTDLSMGAFSWQKPGATFATNLKMAFPPIAAGVSSLRENDPSKSLTNSIRNVSEGALTKVTARELGYVDHFSAGSLDEIFFKTFVIERNRAFQNCCGTLPSGIRSIEKYSVGNIEIILVQGDARAVSAEAPMIANDVARRDTATWIPIGTIQHLVFYSATQKMRFPEELALVDENGRVDNEIYEAAQLSIDRRISFAAISQVNYYSPGCCWDFEPTPSPTVNAYVIAYAPAVARVIYEGVGDAVSQP